MRFLGIDYGTKRIGIAVSDEGNKIAFPVTILANDKKIVDAIQVSVNKNGITTIVLGESKDENGKDNAIMKRIFDFKSELESRLGIPVFLEPEFLTSVQAARNTEDSMLDASAAALILQSYLDRLNR